MSRLLNGRVRRSIHLLVELAKGISYGKLRGAYKYPGFSDKRVASHCKADINVSVLDSIPDIGQDERWFLDPKIPRITNSFLGNAAPDPRGEA